MGIRTRIMSRLALAGLCLGILGYSRCTFVSDPGGTTCGYSSCGGTSGGGGYNGNYVTTLILHDSTGDTSNSFVFGEPIRFDLEIQNNDNMASSLTFPDAQIYEFYVLDAGVNRTRWRWSEGMSFTQQVTTLNFAPYASKAYSVVWNGVLSDGTQLPPGSYRARGVIVAGSFGYDPLASNDLGSNIVNFTVR